MGRIKTQLIKRIGEEVFNKNPGMFKEKFSENKEIVKQVADMDSKKLRNVIAGYVTRKARRHEEI